MILKERTKPVALAIGEILLVRAPLTYEEKRYVSNQVTGFEGESEFDTPLRRLTSECLAVNDLCLKVDRSLFQIDSLVIANGRIRTYEIKHYRGSYDYKDGFLVAPPDFEIPNPLNRCRDRKVLLSKLIRSLGFHCPIDSYVVFMDPGFYLYDLPRREKSFLFHGQLPRHFEEMEKKSRPLSTADKELAEQLCALHIEEFRPADLPIYPFAQMKKGIYCPKCSSFACKETRQTRICSKCGHQENITEAIRRSAAEFRLLYPDERMTARKIYEWCGKTYPMRRVSNVLGQSFNSAGSKRNAYYL